MALMLSIAAGFRVDINTRLISKIRSTDDESVREISFILANCNLIKIVRKCLFFASRVCTSPFQHKFLYRIFSTGLFKIFFLRLRESIESFRCDFYRVFYTKNLLSIKHRQRAKRQEMENFVAPAI